MKFGKSLVVGLALGGLLLLGAGTQARADAVTYIATGTFTGGTTSGTATYTDDAGAVVINYVPPATNTVTSPTQASFGTFDTSTTTATSAFTIPSGVSFTLTLTQVSPTPAGGPLTFTGNLSGAISGAPNGGSSSAFVDFTTGGTSLSQSTPTETYTIVSADHGTPGTVNFSAPGAGSPPGTSTIQGSIVPVPEPASLVLMGLGAPMLLGLARLRRKGRATA